MNVLRCSGALLFAASCASTWLCGCESEAWRPRAPSGITYEYDYQGYQERNTTVVAGTMSGPVGGAAYGAAFSFRNQSELRGNAENDPFAESAPIDAVRFNSHLGNQGIPVASASAPRPSPSGSAVPAPQARPEGSPW